MIDLTPVDVRKKKGDFRRTMRGYDPALVDDFLDMVADRLDELVRENMALIGRVGQEDQQITEYRDRERALTEALVTAQEMREEIRQQTSREADVLRRAAEQEVAQLRAAVQQELAQLRAAAEQEAAELRAAAEREAGHLRGLVERDTAELRTTVRQEREREEEVVRHLRQRQQRLLDDYRAILQRELAAIGEAVEGLGLTGGATTAAPGDVAAGAGASIAAGLAGGIAAAPTAAGAAAHEAPVEPAESAEPAEPTEPTEAVVAEDELFADSSLELVEVEDAEADVLAGAGLATSFVAPMFPEDDDTDTDLGVVSGFDLFDAEPAEPFAPEPVDPLDALDVTRQAAAESFELYEGVAEDFSGDGVPGPIGLSPDTLEPAEPSVGPGIGWSIEDLQLTDEEDAAELASLGEQAIVEAEDEAAERLLRNAEQAGYHLDEDEGELLLLEDMILDEAPPVADAAEPDDADMWLGTFLEDDK